jgi:L,D-transpeptidase ErfK/SrfK
MKSIQVLAILMAASAELFAAGPARRLVISIPDRKVALVVDGRVVKVYSVAVGKQSTPSPAGTFQVTSRIVKPTWYHHGEIVRPGPANPLGTRWLGLSRGYGIHGTNAPSSIGKPESHGCIRMRNRDVEELFEMVQVGDEVDLVTEVDAELAQAFSAAGASETADSGAAQ